MKSPVMGCLIGSIAWLSLAAPLAAHPGHDGPDLTWDLGHLGAHPVATAGCAIVVTGAGYCAWLLARRARRRVQSFRVSQPNRGK